MNKDPANPAKPAVPENSLHVYSIALPLVVIFILFVLGVRTGGDAADTEILILVRFISLLLLAMTVFTIVVVGLNYSKAIGRRSIGQFAAGCMGLSAGFLWSASAYFAGFATLMIGVTVITLLMINEFGLRNQRRRAARRVKFNPMV